MIVTDGGQLCLGVSEPEGESEDDVRGAAALGMMGQLEWLVVESLKQ
jgi:hypothetical protein